MPKKTQLMVLTLARLSEPLTQTSLQVGSDIAKEGRRNVYKG